MDDALYRDEWGVFLSGYAPLLNGEGRYLVGLDMRADEVDHKLAELRLTGLVSLLASFLLALLFALTLSRGMARRMEPLASRCRRIAQGRFEERADLRAFDEFDVLTDALNGMSDELAQSQARVEETMSALREARDGLEQRVQERTRDLQGALDQVNALRGLLPICSACKNNRDDEGYWHKVETFMEKHTDARFTHGLCPRCTVKLYGDILSDAPRYRPVDGTGPGAEGHASRGEAPESGRGS